MQPAPAPFERFNPVGQRGRTFSEVIHVYPGILERLLQCLQPFLLFAQRGACTVNRRLLRKQSVLEGRGKRLRLLNLTLDVIILLLQPFELGVRGVYTCLLFLIGTDVFLRQLQLIKLFREGLELLLCGLKTLAVVSANLGV